MTLAAAIYDRDAGVWVARAEVRMAGFDHVVHAQGDSPDDAAESLRDALDLLWSTRGLWGAS